MELLKKELYTGNCRFGNIKSVNITSYEKTNLKAIKGYEVNGRRYLIKSLNGYINNYALVIISRASRNIYEVIANSASHKFLETYLITSTAVFLPSTKNG